MVDLAISTSDYYQIILYDRSELNLIEDKINKLFYHDMQIETKLISKLNRYYAAIYRHDAGRIMRMPNPVTTVFLIHGQVH